MNYAKLVKVLNSGNDLVKEFLRFGFFYPLVLNNVIEYLTPACVLHYQVKLLRCLNDFIELNYVWMPNQLQYVYLSGYPFHVTHILNLLLLKDFHCHLLTSKVVTAELDLSERTFSNGLA